MTSTDTANTPNTSDNSDTLDTSVLPDNTATPATPEAEAQHRIIIAGCGGMARTWAQYAIARPNAVIVGLVDLYEANARAFAEHFGLTVGIYTELAHALAETDANVVFDVTIPESHKQVGTLAITHGCALLSEKPMAATYDDAKILAELARQSGARYAVMQNRRFLPMARAVKDFLASGAIGKVGSLHADFFLGPHFGGFREAMDHPLILDMAIHTFDQARQLSGADPVSVYCQEWNPPGSWYKGNASAVCIFEMSDGSIFTYRGSWCADGFPTSWQGDWRIIGEKGTVRWDGDHAPVCETIDAASDTAKSSGGMSPLKKMEVPLTWQGREGHTGCLDEMFASLEQGRPAETEYTDNIKSMAMVFGAVESARSGQKVQLV